MRYSLASRVVTMLGSNSFQVCGFEVCYVVIAFKSVDEPYVRWRLRGHQNKQSGYDIFCSWCKVVLDKVKI